MAYSVVVPAGTGDVQAVTGAAELVGFSVRETTAAAATLVLRDGTSTAGALQVLMTLAAGSSQTSVLPAVVFSTGIFVDRTTGTTELVLYLD
ncbi:MAG: hypothetical protein JWO11_3490 [Nocardioides sp.]|nr:hypothetical protein [Nocardioides sp.]